MMRALSLLDDSVITTSVFSGGAPIRRSLPGVLAALVRDEIQDFPRLRPHQRHVWHALLVQLAALALSVAGRVSLPEDERDWRDLLAALTAGDPDCGAWALVGPSERPAFLQSPVPGGTLAGYRQVETPDDLDVLILSKNHDLKGGSLPGDDPELWLYALVSLQTQEGFLGAGNYGISRMNGGFASRPALGVTVEGGPGAAFRRDCRRALALRAGLAEDYGFRSRGGLGLVWLEPWDGTTSLPIDRLDLFYVEICRRVRLVRQEDRWVAFVAGSKVPRIEAKHLKGDTGDLWTPRVEEKDGAKAFTADARGWSYQQMVRLLFPMPSKKGETIVPAPLQALDAEDEPEGLTYLARVVVRGQGKTEGFHERRVPLSLQMRVGLGRRTTTDPIAMIAHDRVKDAGVFARQVLFPAALAIFSGAPRKDAGERARDDDTTRSRAGLATTRFDTLLDPHFFPDLAAEVEVMADAATAERVRAEWILQRLWRIGEAVFDEALARAPDSALRHWRVRVTARDELETFFDRHFDDRLKAAGLSRKHPAGAPAPDIEEDVHV